MRRCDDAISEMIPAGVKQLTVREFLDEYQGSVEVFQAKEQKRLIERFSGKSSVTKSLVEQHSSRIKKRGLAGGAERKLVIPRHSLHLTDQAKRKSFKTLDVHGQALNLLVEKNKVQLDNTLKGRPDSSKPDAPKLHIKESADESSIHRALQQSMKQLASPERREALANLIQLQNAIQLLVSNSAAKVEDN